MEYSELIIITGVALKRTCSSAHYNTYTVERLCLRRDCDEYNIRLARERKS